MDGTDADVLEQIQQQSGAFEHMQDRADEKLNDGNNYAGLMSRDDYKRKRAELLEDPVAKQAEAIADARQADRDARSQAEKERAEREAAKRERIQRELAAAADAGAAGDGTEAADDGAADTKRKKKKKKKSAPGGGLSFEQED